MSIALTVVEAIAPVEVKATGANRPLVLMAIAQGNGKRGDYVVKLKAGERMGNGAAHMREAVCAFMAQHIGLPTPEPVAVLITQAFADGMQGHTEYARLQTSVGLNYGTALLTGASEPLMLSPLNATQRADGMLMLLFDMLLENPDRNPVKPNMLTDGTRLYAIDHELAGAYLLIFGRATGGHLSGADQQQLANHFLRNKLRKDEFDVDELCARLQRFDEAFWAAAWNTLPPEWRDREQYDRMKARVMDIQANATTFITHIIQLLP